MEDKEQSLVDQIFKFQDELHSLIVKHNSLQATQIGCVLLTAGAQLLAYTGNEKQAVLRGIESIYDKATGVLPNTTH